MSGEESSIVRFVDIGINSGDYDRYTHMQRAERRQMQEGRERERLRWKNEGYIKESRGFEMSEYKLV